jgi:tryptophan halogenase
MKKDIVIVGGGTAGWITALYTQKIFPEDNIVLVESSEIGILGAGEGSTPMLVDLLDFLEIPISELIKNTQTTLKQGIKFTNWNKNNEYYFHGFESHKEGLSENFLDSAFSPYFIEKIPVARFLNYINSEKSYENLPCLSSYKNNVVFKLKEDPSINLNPIFDFNQYGAFSIHFDAIRLANYFSKIAQSRGVKRIDGLVNSVEFNNSGDIKKIKLDDGKMLDVDFLFDCSGFARFFIGKQFKSEWVSFKDYLPMKKAIPFFLEIDKENIPPYTESIAMNYGWMWKIPLQHRYGCGYVFDTDFIDEDMAKLEVENFLGHEIAVPKTFNFDPGCYKEVWIKNCMSIGLASSFLEPLEATAIWQIVLQLRSLFSKKESMFNRNEKIISYFNERYLKETTEISYFIYLHYLTNKENTPFWKDFIKNNPIPTALDEIITKVKFSLLSENDNLGIFGKESYYQIADGLSILDKENIKSIYINNNLSIFNNIINKQNSLNDILSDGFVSHSNFIKCLGGLSE